MFDTIFRISRVELGGLNIKIKKTPKFIQIGCTWRSLYMLYSLDGAKFASSARLSLAGERHGPLKNPIRRYFAMTWHGRPDFMMLYIATGLLKDLQYHLSVHVIRLRSKLAFSWSCNTGYETSINRMLQELVEAWIPI